MRQCCRHIFSLGFPRCSGWRRKSNLVARCRKIKRTGNSYLWRNRNVYFSPQELRYILVRIPYGKVAGFIVAFTVNKRVIAKYVPYITMLAVGQKTGCNECVLRTFLARLVDLNWTGGYRLVEAAWEFLTYIEVLVAKVCSKYCIIANVVPLCVMISMNV